MSEIDNTCRYPFCEYLDNDNLFRNCDHSKDCQCHKSRDALMEELDILKKKMHIEKAYRTELSNEISNHIKVNNDLKKVLKEYQDEIIQKNNALDAEKEYRYDLMKTNTNLEVGLISAYIIISILFALLTLK